MNNFKAVTCKHVFSKKYYEVAILAYFERGGLDGLEK